MIFYSVILENLLLLHLLAISDYYGAVTKNRRKVRKANNEIATIDDRTSQE
jgi:hypothetical protein